MRKLPHETRAQILHLLCEGQSIRAVTRITGASKNTVTKLLIDAGRACMAYHDAKVRDVKARRVQVDEIWSFVYAKQRNVATAKRLDLAYGDVWTWTAIDADSKLILTYLIGGRDSDYAIAFMDDLCSRLANRVQLTSDGHRAYLEAVEGAFGGDIDYAMLVKLYGAGPDCTKGRYSPAECIGARKRSVEGDPDSRHISTSFAERNNLTMRMHIRRFTRLTNAFSKKIENHAYAVALHMMYYNFVRIHSTLRMTSAMAAGVSDRLWEIGDIVKLVEDAEAKPGKRGPYKKKNSN
ncbi:MAG: DDE-type integrase/transposase/recombinase [Proteobacteria bacterium]|nr:DDE-type integrase/transposase/recombinase [Pseudomonadota bacterium]